MSQHFAGFPRQEILDNLVAGKTYREEAGWHLFKDINPDGSIGNLQILLTLGDFWTLIDADEFKRMFERIVRQL